MSDGPFGDPGDVRTGWAFEVVDHAGMQLDLAARLAVRHRVVTGAPDERLEAEILRLDPLYRDARARADQFHEQDALSGTVARHTPPGLIESTDEVVAHDALQSAAAAEAGMVYDYGMLASAADRLRREMADFAPLVRLRAESLSLEDI